MQDYGKLLEDVYDDAEGAFRHYLMAFERGDLQSAYNVGVCYGRGYGVDADPDDTIWLRPRQAMPMRSSR